MTKPAQMRAYATTSVKALMRVDRPFADRYAAAQKSSGSCHLRTSAVGASSTVVMAGNRKRSLSGETRVKLGGGGLIRDDSAKICVSCDKTR
jgi:hypothetical protein